MMKICFKCGESKPLVEFYQDSRMADGHLNKCKDCTRRDVKQNRLTKRDQYIDYEQRRNRTPERRQRRAEQLKKHRAMYPDKNDARRKVADAIRYGRLIRQPCKECGETKDVQAHHTDYSKPLDVEWLCPTCHRRVEGRLAA